MSIFAIDRMFLMLNLLKKAINKRTIEICEKFDARHNENDEKINEKII